ncbi:MAG: methyltransferase domain-containing protein [Anaerolineae bacterium]|nr:methyltransferase domain-containing protein [Anaerolineae bacterium]
MIERRSWAERLYQTSRVVFALAFVLAMMTPSWREGTFVRWPLLHAEVGGIEMQFGILSLLPALCILAWVAARLFKQPRCTWRWGSIWTALPLLGFGAWTLIRVWPVHLRHVAFVTVVSVLIFWGAYLYSVNVLSRRWMVSLLAALTLLQGAIGTIQFVRQESLGLFWMGEGCLDPMRRGVSVVEAAGRRWVRAYGMTAHPNVLGGYLAMGALICLAAGVKARGRWRWMLWGTAGVGALGLLFTFSRSAWLGAGIGLVYLLSILRPCRAVDWRSRRVRRTMFVLAGLAVVALLVFLWLYGDLLVTRFFRLDSPLESASIQERLVDVRQAWSLIHVVPFKGTGPGYYVGALWARVTDPAWKGFRTIHNIPLLVTAELGIPGLLLWLWLILGPPLALWRHKVADPLEIGLASALVVAFGVSMLDNYLYIPTTWWPALFLGLLLGSWTGQRQEQDHVRYRDIAQGFDLAAGCYDDETTRNSPMADMRRISLETLLSTFKAGDRLLEIGCGTGEEAIALARAGVRVLATDLSGAMVEIAARKVVEAGLDDWVQVRQLAAGEFGVLVDEWGVGAFDGAYASFGPLNGEPDLAGIADVLRQLIKPGGRLLVGVMNRFYLWETAWFALRGHPRQAVRRWGGKVLAGVSPSLPVLIPTWYYTPRQFARAFASFRQVSCRALPLLLPPPYAAYLWPKLRFLHALERRLASLWPFNALGDHFLMVLERRQKLNARTQ